MSSQGKTESIEHDGIVQESGNNHLTVRISSASACAGCHAEGSCTMSGKEEKIIDVTGSYNVSPGDKVTILMKQSAGYTALFLGYILPLIVVMAVLILLISISVPELTAGLGAVGVLIPYYSALWLFRKHIGKKFTFTIKA
ncbi:MAG: SoxR reducing system RseC family protein [Bacteroidia bacterium]|nr:SoxR reducing system RseC family protein [Bacteroidia bacterium]